jgi:hypothetical protein
MDATLRSNRHILLGAAIALQQIFGTGVAAAFLADIGVPLTVALELLTNSTTRHSDLHSTLYRPCSLGSEAASLPPYDHSIHKAPVIYEKKRRRLCDQVAAIKE